MTDLSSLKVGSNRKKVKIISVSSKLAKPDDKGERIYIETRSDDGAEYKVNEVWTKDHKGNIVVRSLWLSLDDSKQNILETSQFGELLKYLGCSGPTDLIGKEVIVSPKENKFMAIIMYE